MTDTPTTPRTGPPAGPHARARVYATGAALEDARAAVILLHGRGASAADILGLADPLGGEGIAFVAPEAVGNAWYPQRFIRPTAENEPFLSSAVETVAAVADRLVEAGIPAERIVLAGFSQGACLALETAVRHPRRWGGVLAFSGGLIGDEREILGHAGDLAGTPVFLGCSDVDAHIPASRVHDSARVLAGMGAVVTERLYPGMPHTINDDEIRHAAALVATVAATAAA